ncbi:hypothetical protein PanWU01x14_062220 [Parasponia andersonii]|uniref:Uncharacterized protein n=1 Tax=Parasponia andersonii TaxID=3476 RepID=A0A2P5DHL2_PARAD|nr:hypothetical protein PanWU01x14_062220 [Parasponia andersonii]
MASRIRFVVSTIQSEILDKSSTIIIDRFISILEFMDRELSCYTKDMSTKGNLSFGEMESGLLGMILFEVLNLETAFNDPILFPMWFTSKDVLREVAKNIRKSFASKLLKISLKITKLKMEFSKGDQDPKG